MKRIWLLFSLLVACCMAGGAQKISVGQFNIRYDNKSDRERGEGWDVRMPKVCNLINYEGWDVFGAQEVLHNQLLDLKQALKDYDHVGVGRSDGKTKGEYAPIFYKKSRMRCLSSGTFCLSETPDVAGSKGWDAALPRICTWAYFEDKSTKWRLWCFNLHMDHKGVVARKEAAKLVIAKIREMCGDEPFILTGDFNVDQNNEVYQIITDSGILMPTYDKAKYRMAETGSMNYFNPQYKTDSRIDHVFVSSKFRVDTYGVLTYFHWIPIQLTEEKKAAIARGEEGVAEHELRVISDHFPVSVTVELPRLRTPQDWAQYGRYAKNNAEVKQAKVVFMGNSITDNWDRFRPEFFTENEGYVCRGISGQVTAQMLARFRADVINLKPETVVILAGTNDIAMNQGYVSLDHIFENIVSMAELAKANGIQVVLCSILPANRYSWSWEISHQRAIDSINELNSRMRAYAAENGLAYADYYSVMVDEKFGLKKEYQQDAVHPNREGYLVMEKVIQEILK